MFPAAVIRRTCGSCCQALYRQTWLNTVTSKERSRLLHSTAVSAAVLKKISQVLAEARPQARSRANEQTPPSLHGNNISKDISKDVADRPPKTKQKSPASRNQRRQPDRSGAAEPSDYRPADPILSMPRVFGDIEQPQDAEVGKFVIFGAANAGKSTLVNRLTGANVSIVSARPQTTRTRIMAAVTIDNKQMLFLDTPGVVSRQGLRRVSRSVVTAPWLTLPEADLAIILLDAYKLTQKTDEVEQYLFKHLRTSSSVPAILVVNKIDLVEDQQKLAEKVKHYMAEYPHIVEGPLFISALGNVNVDSLKSSLLSRTAPGKWQVPASVNSDMSSMMRVEELIRAEWFSRLKGHLPYVVRQKNVAWEYVEMPIKQTTMVFAAADTASPDGAESVEHTLVRTVRTLVIKQQLTVPSGGVAKILLGADGQNIKDIGRDASNNIADALGIPTRLHLQVVVEEDTTHRK
ncbi:hypothetical protein H4R99_001463 [Coemansia sp. RSA 1722]|nr:hypothetical protein H4R99_001463 [Coemansia sp. RSA 1722]